jgi:exopolysaccharide production protein ExoZ
VVLSLLFLPHHDPAGAVAPVIVPGWTLNYEAFFYVTFALTLLAPRGRRATILTLGLGLLCLAGLALRPTGSAILATYTDPLILEFVAGVWLAKAAAAGDLGRTNASLGAVAAGLVILGGVAVAGLDASGWARLAEWGLPALLIVWGALGLEGAGRLPRWPALKLLGDASYSIYLAHGLALSAAFRIGEGLDLPTAVQLWLGIPFAVLAGLLCHLLVEKPLLALFHGRRRRRERGPAFVAGMAQS